MNKNIIFLGPPGSGKGTQAQKLISDFNLVHLSTGDIIRNAIKQKTKTGLQAKDFINNGLLVPDEIIINLVKEKILATKQCFILDGFPRTIVQGKALAEIARPIDIVIYLEIDLDKLVNRLSGRLICPKCGRSYHEISMRPKVDNLCDNDQSSLIKRIDDQPDKIKVRMKTYLEQTLPLINFYQNQKILYVIDANQESQDVYNDIKKVLRKIDDNY